MTWATTIEEKMNEVHSTEEMFSARSSEVQLNARKMPVYYCEGLTIWALMIAVCWSVVQCSWGQSFAELTNAGH
jgi:hypothetical protein